LKAGIVAFGFAVPETVTSNRQIAQITEELALEHDAPIFTQYVVSIEEGFAVENADDRPNDPPPTLRIARKAVAWARHRRIEKLIVVAAIAHRWRTTRDMRMAIEESGATIQLEFCEEVSRYEKWFFPNENEQWYTKTAVRWYLRDALLWLMPWWLYKRIAC